LVFRTRPPPDRSSSEKTGTKGDMGKATLPVKLIQYPAGESDCPLKPISNILFDNGR
jgi:hypothetical protein